MVNYKQKLKSIKTFIFDVDGVLTTGDVVILKNESLRSLNSRDAFAIQFATKIGCQIFVITKADSESLKARLLELGVTEVCLCSQDKLKDYKILQEKYKLENEEIAYMGDDIPDYPVMLIAGFAACPVDAAVEILNISDYHSPFQGGRYCVRDLIEQTLRVQNKWFKEG